MTGFLTDFLSLGSGALAAQALYFLFVKYPYELRRLDSEVNVMTTQFELDCESWNETFGVLGEANTFAAALLTNWKGMDNSAERANARREIEKRWRNIQALYRIEGEPMARALRLLEEVLGDIHQALLKEEEPSVDDRVSLMRHAGTMDKSVEAIKYVENTKSLLNRAKVGAIENEVLSLKTLCLWSRIGLLVYGLLVAVASAMAIFRSGVKWHPLLAYADAIVLVVLTIAMLSYSFYQERKLKKLLHTKDGKENA